jgi:hypothetical protein
MDKIMNSYGYLVPKNEYEKLQNKVDQMNEIRMNGLREFNKVLEKIGLVPIALDGNKAVRDLIKTNVDGTVPDNRIKRFPAPYKNPYDIDFEDRNLTECELLMKQRIQNFEQINPENEFSNIAVKMKKKFENKLSYFVSQSVNPIRFELMKTIHNMNLDDFIKIYFRWQNNIAGEEVFHVNYVINQWASYFGIESKVDYDFMTGEDKEAKNKNEKRISFGLEDEQDKEIRHHFYGFYEG